MFIPVFSDYSADVANGFFDWYNLHYKNFVLLIWFVLCIFIGSGGEKESGTAHVGCVHAKQEYKIA